MSNYLRSLPNPQPFHLGQIAYADGKPIDANPYKPGYVTLAEYPGIMPIGARGGYWQKDGLNMEKLKVLDLFSGIGGFSLGLERTGGFETVAFCEIEHFPRRVLAKHWPEVPCYEDITTADFEAIGPVDLVTGGFPCQDLSFAGKGAGLAGERSGLFWHILRTVCMVGRPKLLLENVAALLNRGMGAVLGALAQVGYDAEWHCLPASYVGAWHRRDRVWILAYPNEIRCEGGTAQPMEWQREVTRQSLRSFEGWPGRSNLSPSRFCRAADGVSARVDRTAALGNAVVPAIPELIGRAILSAEAKAPRR